MFSSSPSPKPEKIIESLKIFQDPFSSHSVVEAGLIGSVNIEKGGRVIITLQTPPEKVADYEELRQKITDGISLLPGVEKVLTVMTTHKGETPTPPPLPPAVKIELPEVQHVIAIASGKGGVGKSLTALNLALAFQKLGKKTGLLDADIYGPSLPKMMGLGGKPKTDDQKRLIPPIKFGLQCMSMGFFVPEDMPMIWRGPMIQTAVLQLTRDVAWKDLDILVVDLPPGTGDTQLTLIQKVPLAGVVIVSTPQDLALIDARKGLHMFQKLHIPILGIIENMSYFSCPACHHRSEIFHHGGAHEEARKLGIPFLGEIPLTIDLRRASDEGLPLIESDPHHPLSEIFLGMAKQLIHQITQQNTKINFND
ncbi:flagellum site-determining protein YlxH [Caedimonas varicaedens]|jgi:ATP-binding protein involved in chromosome partitioning|uniref:Iron-sulfur cluster carrier protein n=1 Tax=Caedimonas varicaedens TaxID=1629334 RepID=A0A0K8MC71_9PROT|nr:flagellum site-determining protein YlxH [Caedimonas varicaedens]